MAVRKVGAPSNYFQSMSGVSDSSVWPIETWRGRRVDINPIGRQVKRGLWASSRKAPALKSQRIETPTRPRMRCGTRGCKPLRTELSRRLPAINVSSAHSRTGTRTHYDEDGQPMARATEQVKHGLPSAVNGTLASATGLPAEYR
jgi:hypothetical protein